MNRVCTKQTPGTFFFFCWQMWLNKCATVLALILNTHPVEGTWRAFENILNFHQIVEWAVMKHDRSNMWSSILYFGRRGWGGGGQLRKDPFGTICSLNSNVKMLQEKPKYKTNVYLPPQNEIVCGALSPVSGFKQLFSKIIIISRNNNLISKTRSAYNDLRCISPGGDGAKPGKSCLFLMAILHFLLSDKK